MKVAKFGGSSVADAGQFKKKWKKSFKQMPIDEWLLSVLQVRVMTNQLR